MVWLSRASFGVDSPSLESVSSRALLVRMNWPELSMAGSKRVISCVTGSMEEVFSDFVLVGSGCLCVCCCVHGVSEGKTSDNLGWVSDQGDVVLVVSAFAENAHERSTCRL